MSIAFFAMNHTTQNDRTISQDTRGDVAEVFSPLMTDSPKMKLFPSWRLAVAVLCCAGLAVCFIQRTNISISIICMVNETNGTNVLQGPFFWSQFQIGNLFSAYYYGYAATQMLGGFLAFRYGPKAIAFISIIGSSLFTLLTPVMAYISLDAVIVIRAIIGGFAGLLWSSLLQIAAVWFPLCEKGYLIAIINVGASLGVILASPISAEFCLAGCDWEWTFYFSGILGITWCIIWMVLIKSTVADHKYIKKEEREYIVRSAGVSKRPKNIPFGTIMKSFHCWGFFSSHTLMAFVFHAFAIYIWLLLKTELKSNLRKLSYSVAFYWVTYMIMTPVSGFLSDLLIEKNKLSRTNTRRLFVCIACLIPATMTLILGFKVFDNFWVKVAIFTVMYAAMAANSGGGIMLTANDMAPEFPSALWGISNTFATIAGIVASVMIGSLRKKDELSSWRIIMFTCTGANILSAAIFVMAVIGDPIPELITTSD